MFCLLYKYQLATFDLSWYKLTFFVIQVVDFPSVKLVISTYIMVCEYYGVLLDFSYMHVFMGLVLLYFCCGWSTSIFMWITLLCNQ